MLAYIYAPVAKRALIAELRLFASELYVTHRAGFDASPAAAASRWIEARLALSKGAFVPNFHPKSLS